jgi:uncharacterized protein
MKYELNAKEARVIGCLLEKQVTTPDQYPLSLNAITLASRAKPSTRENMVIELTAASDFSRFMWFF